MTDHIVGLLLVLGAVCAESCAHVAFKGFARGVEPGPAGIARAAILRWRRLLAGIGMFLVMIVCWTLALRAIDLSVAQPLSSMGLLVTLGLSRVTLRETLGPRRWVGGLLITAGVIAVGLSQ